jgi:hypothetical protein
MLPFEKGFQMHLLEQFDKVTPDQKFEIEQIVWDTYEMLYKLKLEENMQTALARAKSGQEKLDSDFYARVKEQTENEFESNLQRNTTGFDISHIRSQLTSIISDTPTKA